jgi:hypothetical protein
MGSEHLLRKEAEITTLAPRRDPPEAERGRAKQAGREYRATREV